jgi:hypothetical protein
MSNQDRRVEESSRQCCKLVAFERIVEERGVLTVGQVGGALPFVARRVFFIDDVPEGRVRGYHAHRRIEEVLIALRGRVLVELQGRGRRRQVMLDKSTFGLHVTPGVYNTQQFFDRALLLVLASDQYDASGYVYDPVQATGDVGDE